MARAPGPAGAAGPAAFLFAVAKAALAVLDVLPPGELAGAVAREDKAAVARANGVGPKLALRIVTELKGKPLGEVSFTPSAPGVHAEAAPPPAEPPSAPRL